MSWELLPTDYTDRTWNGQQRFNEIDNGDGTVSFLDVTVYTNKEKSFFGAKDANRMNEALNTLMSMVEQGTDLYEVFQQYFETQKELFAEETDLKQSEFENRLAELNESATTTLSAFDTYITQLKQAADSAVQAIKDGYAADIAQYEQMQQAVFDAWFQAMKDQLSQDAAGHLQNEIDDILATRIIIEVTCQEILEGQTITCTNGTDTKTAVVGETHVVTFEFGSYGIYTVTDSLTGMPTSVKAYHYGYHPIGIKMGVIRITCPDAMIGHIVTCQKDDVVYKKTVGNDRVVIFGTPTLGIWEVSNDLTEQTFEMNVEDYETYTAEFQIAEVIITCDTRFENEMVYITDGSSTFSQKVPDTGIVNISIPTFGTWTISNTKTKDTVQLAINAYTTYYAEFGIAEVHISCADSSFEGETVYLKKGTETITAVIPDTMELTIELSGLGEWKCTNSRTTSEYTINATSYQTYNIVLALATLEVNYVEDFVGENFTITEVGGTKTYTQTADSSLKLYFALDIGTWKLTNTLTTAQRTIEVTEYMTYTVTIKTEEQGFVGGYVGSYVTQ